MSNLRNPEYGWIVGPRDAKDAGYRNALAQHEDARVENARSGDVSHEVARHGDLCACVHAGLRAYTAGICAPIFIGISRPLLACLSVRHGDGDRV